MIEPVFVDYENIYFLILLGKCPKQPSSSVLLVEGKITSPLLINFIAGGGGKYDTSSFYVE